MEKEEETPPTAPAEAPSAAEEVAQESGDPAAAGDAPAAEDLAAFATIENFLHAEYLPRGMEDTADPFAPVMRSKKFRSVPLRERAIPMYAFVSFVYGMFELLLSATRRRGLVEHASCFRMRRAIVHEMSNPDTVALGATLVFRYRPRSALVTEAVHTKNLDRLLLGTHALVNVLANLRGAPTISEFVRLLEHNNLRLATLILAERTAHADEDELRRRVRLMWRGFMDTEHWAMTPASTDPDVHSARFIPAAEALAGRDV